MKLLSFFSAISFGVATILAIRGSTHAGSFVSMGVVFFLGGIDYIVNK